MGVKVNGHTADSVFSKWIDRYVKVLYYNQIVVCGVFQYCSFG
jgi:hypothetical protein